MDILNHTQTDILTLLARFKFLVLSQMQPLLDKSVSYIRSQLARLASKGYISSLAFDRPGKSENMYYLTEDGKELILQYEKMFDSDIKLPIGVPVLVKDYPHRKNMISLTIVLYYHLLKLDIKIDEFINYFDKQGENRKSGTLEARTKIPLGGNDAFFIPDGIMITSNGEKRTIHIVEMYCDLISSRPVEQLLQKHLLCIANGTPAAKFNIPANPIVLSAFEHDSIKNKVIERLSSNKSFQPFQHLFYFGTLAELQNDGNAWYTISNDKIVFT